MTSMVSFRPEPAPFRGILQADDAYLLKTAAIVRQTELHPRRTADAARAPQLCPVQRHLGRKGAHDEARAATVVSRSRFSAPSYWRARHLPSAALHGTCMYVVKAVTSPPRTSADPPA
jgi:hypothetical protein